MHQVPHLVAMTFSGGLGLGAYHAGVIDAFARLELPLHWVSGSSAGAVTAALIAGSPCDERVSRLHNFWRCPPVGRPTSPSRHLYGWLSALEAGLAGSAGFFRPRLPSFDSFRFRSFYDLAPMRQRLATLVDFGRLNAGELRVSIAATDLETGEAVIFDSQHTRLEMDHLLASCGLVPEFAPVEVGGRMLGDGGLCLNAPFDPILEESVESDLLLYVVDLYARDGARPTSLEAALERRNDLLFANQTFMRLNGLAQLRALRRQAAGTDPGTSGDRIVLLSYRPGMEEPGPAKSFELSASALAQRWQAGMADMNFAQALAPQPAVTFVRRPVPG